VLPAANGSLTGERVVVAAAVGTPEFAKTFNSVSVFFLQSIVSRRLERGQRNFFRSTSLRKTSIRDKVTKSRVARWHIFKTKFQICVDFIGPCNGRFWSTILWLFGLFYVRLVYFTATWDILWLCGICIFPVLVYFTKKNLVTLTKRPV
jgi:hypothetical protein